MRDMRKAISAEFDDDPEKIVEHYIAEQEQHRDRLLRPIAAQRAGATDRPPSGR